MTERTAELWRLRATLSLSEFSRDATASPEELLATRELSEILAGLLRSLPARARSRDALVLVRHFVEGTPLAEIAEDAQISRERTAQVKNKALRRLRHPSKVKRLSHYWDADRPLDPALDRPSSCELAFAYCNNLRVHLDLFKRTDGSVLAMKVACPICMTPALHYDRSDSVARAPMHARFSCARCGAAWQISGRSIMLTSDPRAAMASLFYRNPYREHGGELRRHRIPFWPSTEEP